MDFLIDYTHAIRLLTEKETVLIVTRRPSQIKKSSFNKKIEELEITDFKLWGTEKCNRASIVLFKDFEGIRILKDHRSTFTEKIYYND